MVITNTTKLFMRNVGLVWQILLYVLACVLIVGAITVAACLPMFEKLGEAGLGEQLKELYSSTLVNLRLDQIFVDLGNIFVSFGTILSQNPEVVIPLLIVLILMIEVVGKFLIGLSELALADCLYGFMGSNIKANFLGSLVKNLGKSTRFQLSKLTINLPFNLVIYCVFIACALLSTIQSFWAVMFAPTLCVLLITFMLAFKQTLFCTWSSCIVVQNGKIWPSFKTSVKGIFKNFGKIYGRQLIITICFIAINIAAVILTASVGLIFTIPACMLYSSTFAMVIYFYINGLKFYVDSDTIYSPKKKEDWEPLQDLRYIV